VQLVINTYGAYLRKSGNCFLVKREDKSFEVAVNKVNSIIMTLKKVYMLIILLHIIDSSVG
jgi:CRISPR/Cas system-associated endonuclease Cas1